MPLEIDFRTIESESTFLDPRKNFEPTTIQFQVRIDPLTGRTGHLSHFGRVAPQKLDLASYLRPELKGYCPFCPENRNSATPKFPEELLPGGRASLGETLLIPNLFPYEAYSGIAIMSNEHMVPLSGFTKEKLSDTFSLGVEFLKRTRRVSPSLPYHLVSWNYMPPSGGGLVHPHQQYFATEHPGNQFMDELRASERFSAQHGRTFWNELIKEEAQNNARYIGRTGDAHWLTPFVCFGVFGDILCIFPDVFSVDDFAGSHIDDLVSGLLKVFRYYESVGIYSFNASLLFGPTEQQHFSCHFRIVPRTFLNIRDFAPDVSFFQMILAEPICTALPEDLCRQVRDFFV